MKLSFKRKSTRERPKPDYPQEERYKAPGLHGPKHPGGRPTILNDDIIQEFEDLLPTVAYVETAADLMGIHRFVWRNWIKIGKEECLLLATKPGYLPATPFKELCIKFYSAYRRGLARFKERNLQMIGNSDQWQAHMALLQRRCPEEWGEHAKEIQDIKRQVKAMEQEVLRNQTGPKPTPTPPIAIPVFDTDAEKDE